MDRREFIKHIGSAAVATSVVLSACKNNDSEATPIAKNVIDGQGEMTYRTNPNSGDKVSLLGYGMMRGTRRQLLRHRPCLYKRLFRDFHRHRLVAAPAQQLLHCYQALQLQSHHMERRGFESHV